MFVIPAGNHNRFAFQSMQPGNGAAGAGADGIVNIGDAAKLPNLLQAVLHPLEAHGHLLTDFGVDQAPCRFKSGQVIEHVVLAGKTDVALRQDRFAGFTINTADDIAQAECPLLCPVFIREIADL